MAVSVLLVDPEETFVSRVVSELRQGDAVVSGLSTVAEALRFLRQIQPEIVILNPAIEGGGLVLDQIQRNWPELDVILLHDSTSLPEAGGPARALSRSADTAQLVAEIQSIIGSRSAAPQVLVVDDDPDILALFSKALTDAGYAVATAMTSEETMEQLGRHETLQLVLMDLVIPTEGGLEVLARIGRRSHGPRVIVVSAVSDEELSRRAHRLGAADYLVKPVLPDDLIEAVGKAMMNHQ